MPGGTWWSGCSSSEGCLSWQGFVRSVVGTSSGGGCGSTSPSCGRYSGGGVLAAYGVVAALQPISEFGRVYAAYGGIFIALALLWGITVDRFRPDRWTSWEPRFVWKA